MRIYKCIILLTHKLYVRAHFDSLYFSLCLTMQDGPLYISPMTINRSIKLYSIYRILCIFPY